MTGAHSSSLYRLFNIAAIFVLLFSPLGRTQPAAQARPTAVCTVTSANDSGAGTLRQCLLDAANGDTIDFDTSVFPPGSPATINLLSVLPALTLGSQTLDASNAGVILDGAGISDPNPDGLTIESDSNVIRGLTLLHFGMVAIVVNSGDHNVIGGQSGIGSGLSGQGNVLIANQIGILVNTATNTQILGNKIGVAADGLSPVGNGDGIDISGGTGTQIGSSIPGEGNIIGVNNGHGVNITNSSNNFVQGNNIGVGVDGNTAVRNGNGIIIQGISADNLVGGANPGEGNLIFTNKDSGIVLSGTDVTGNNIIGNQIGINTSLPRQAYPTHMAISSNYASDCTLYVATLDQGIKKSTDCGATWEWRSNGLGNDVAQVYIPPDAVNANTVFAITGKYDTALYQTTDGGLNWYLLSYVMQKIDHRNLALSSTFSADQTMWTAVENWSWSELGGQPGVFKSTDGGVTWTNKSDGMSNNQVFMIIASPEPASKNTLFALTQGGIQKSTDGGENWTPIGWPDSSINALAISPSYSSDQTLFATASSGQHYFSYDGGNSWSSGSTPMGDPRNPTFSPNYASDSVVCATTSRADWLYCSNDGGTTWSYSDITLSGWVDNSLTTIFFSPAFASDSTLYIICNNGLARSEDSGASVDVVRSLHNTGNRNGVRFSGGAHHNNILDNVISNNFWGIVSDGGSYNVIQGNLVGTDPTGAYPIYNTDHGIAIFNGDHYQIGGDTPAERNIISNTVFNAGLVISGSNSYANIVTGNYIGTNITGNVGFGFGNNPGIQIRDWTHDNIIGGSAPGEGNLISGNKSNGIQLTGRWTMNNLVQGNYIGTDSSGMSALGNNSSGIQVDSGSNANTIDSNLISGNGGYGVQIEGYETNYNTVTGNIIGLDVNGSYAVPNYLAGVWIYHSAQNNTIGGPDLEDRNIISGNGLWQGWNRGGVVIGNPSTAGNLVQGNFIGTDITGLVAIGNYGPGISIWTSASGNTIDGNLISGNHDHGIFSLNLNVGNTINYNLIGVDITGTQPLGNAWSGIYFGQGGWDGQAPAWNTINGNTISGNGSSGIELQDGPQNNTVINNFIGTDSTGNKPIPNGAVGGEKAGVQPDYSVCQPASLMPDQPVTDKPCQPEQQKLDTAKAPTETNAPFAALPNNQSGVYLRGSNTHNNTIGPGNVIAYNNQNGVTVDENAFANTITQNSIFANQLAGISLVNGGNWQIKPPRILSRNLATGVVSGTSDCAGCTIEVFSTGDEQGHTYEGSTITDGSNNWTFNAGHALTGPQISATKTDGYGNTSPFSQPFSILVYDMGVQNNLNSLNNLGFDYTLISRTDFATVDLSQFDVLFVGFTGNDPQPDDLLQPLLDRQADIRAYVQNGGSLIAHSEDGVVATPLDWQWVPVPVTHRTAHGNQMLINKPLHLLMEGLKEGDMRDWSPYHNTFTAWDWPQGDVIMSASGSNEAILLAGPYGSGKMILSGSDPDYHCCDERPMELLRNEILWSVGRLVDSPPQVRWSWPNGNSVADRTSIYAGFDQLLDPASVNTTTVTVSGTLSGPVSGTVINYDKNGYLEFRPDAPLMIGETITVVLSGAMTDLTGNGLDGNYNGVSDGSPSDDYTFTFDIRAPSTWMVDSTADDSKFAGLTLRQAMQNAQSGDTILFNPVVFPPGNPATIAIVNNPLPSLNQSFITIDGNGGVILDGSALTNGGRGIDLYGDGYIIQGLQILNFPDHGISFNGNHNLVGGTNATPGTGCSGECNVLAGNRNNGIEINNSRLSTISGNYIGANAAGDAPLANTWAGIVIGGDSHNNTIGGPGTGEGNVIFANGNTGISLTGNVTETWITNNQIGFANYTPQQIWPSDAVLSPNYANDCMLFTATLIQGIYKSIDCGATWFAVNNGLTDSRFLQVEIPPDAPDSNLVYALAENGYLYITHDGGASWNLHSKALEMVDRRNIALSADFMGDNTIYAAAENWSWNEMGGEPGLFKSTDGGITWLRKTEGMGNNRVRKVIASTEPASAGVLFAITQNTIEKSIDFGENWTPIPFPSLSSNNDLAISPNFSIDQTLMVTTDWGREFFSYDGGNNWDEKSNWRGDPRFPVFSPDYASDHLVCHGGGWTDWLFCTTDGGDNWVESNTLMPAPMRNENQSILFSPNFTSDQTIFVVSFNGMSRSTDGGQTFDILRGLHDTGSNQGIALSNGANHNIIGPGNVISNNDLGITINNSGTNDNVVAGNLIGTDPSGTVALGNTEHAVALWDGSNNIIGGTTPEARNVISGSVSAPTVWLCGWNVTNNTVAGNYIGTDINGATILANNQEGVGVSCGSSFNTIGPGNVISGNWTGVIIRGGDTHHITVTGNLLGTDASGLYALPNRYAGVEILNSSHDNLVDSNLVSGNMVGGVEIRDWETKFNVVTNNLIGTDISGMRAIPNGRTVDDTSAAKPGARLDGCSFNAPQYPQSWYDEPERFADAWRLVKAQPVIKPCNPSTVVQPASTEDKSGSAPASPAISGIANQYSGVFIAWGAQENIVGPGNTIANNHQNGVRVQGGDAYHNTITQNSIYDNWGRGIDLIDGANNDIPRPHVFGVNLTAGTARGTACANCTVELFSSTDPEGRVYEGSTTADGDGNWTFNAGHPLSGPHINATATDANGNTSRFSQPFSILVYDLNVPETMWQLDNIGVSYSVVDATGFASINLNDYDIFFVGFAGNDPQPPDLFQPLMDRKADIAAFVQNGGSLVVNSEGGNNQTPLDWQWVPVDVTYQAEGGQQMHINLPQHVLMDSFFEADLRNWWPFHNTFTSWDWPQGEEVLTAPESGNAILLAGNYGIGKMILSGSDPDIHGEEGASKLLTAEIYWSVGFWVDGLPTVNFTNPNNDEVAAPQSNVRVWFTEMIDPATINSFNFTLIGSQSGSISGTLEYLEDKGLAVFTPANPLQVGETITVLLSASILDMTGNGLDGNANGIAEGSPVDDYRFTFTIRQPLILEVNSTSDNWPKGGMTLRRAMTLALPGDTITFDPVIFPIANPATIFVENQPLPEIQQNFITISGVGSGVIIDGSHLQVWSDGLVLKAGFTTIQGLHVRNFSNAGLNIESAVNLIGGENASPGAACSDECNLITNNGWTGIYIAGNENIVSGNYIGVDRSGSMPLPNGEGITLDGRANLIGGDTPAEANIISGNYNHGVGLFSTTADNVITGNLIGTDTTGTQPLGNGNGVQLLWGASNNIIGPNNTISGNNYNGVLFEWAHNNTVIGNRIGVDITGMQPLSNGGAGVQYRNGSKGNTIGGLLPGEGNTIGANNGGGVTCNSGQFNLLGNLIGFDAAGLAPLGNGWENAVYMLDCSNSWVEGNRIGNSPNSGISYYGSFSIFRNNIIGENANGDPAGNGTWGLAIKGWPADPYIEGIGNLVEGNILAHNSTGLGTWRHLDAVVEGNTFTHNSIYANSYMGIDLFPGTNSDIIQPVVTAYNATMGTASGTACPDCTIEVFSGLGPQAKWYEGVTTANGSGNWSLTAGHAFTGSIVRATATNANGNTSEFSGDAPVVSEVGPSGATPGTLDLGVKIVGDNFRDNPPTGVNFGAGITVNEISSISKDVIYVYINVAPGAATGLRNVTVTNNDGQSGNLPGGFTVQSSPPPPPTVSGAMPDEAGPGLTSELYVSGEGFIDRPQVSFNGGDVTVNWVSFIAPHKLQIGITVASGAPLGLRDITVTNPDGQSDSLAGALKIVAPTFSEETSAYGLAMSGGETGAAWGDYDTDGWLDLATGTGQLFRNTHGAPFSDQTPASGIEPMGSYGAPAWGDANNDGELDLLFSWGKVYTQGSLPFNKVMDTGASQATVAWVDYDRDGDIDAYASGRLYRNDGGDTYTEVTGDAGLDPSGFLKSSVWADYDNDGDPDMFLAQQGSGPARLYRNNGNGTFTDAGLQIWGSLEGSAWGDYDNDGDMDLAIAMNDGQFSILMRNDGDGTFSDVSDEMGFHDRQAMGTGISWLDYNLDGWLDVFIADRGGRSRLYRNMEGQVFGNYGPSEGLTLEGNSDGSTVGDFDNDGDPDIYAVSGFQTGSPNLLWVNNLDHTGKHWLKVKLIGTLSNFSAIGAKVRVIAGGTAQYRQFAGSSGYMGQDALEALYGFGGHTSPVTIEITWPSGMIDTYTNVTLNQTVTYIESTGRLHDLTMIGVLPAGEQPMGVPFQPVATIRNLGQFSEATPVTCRIIQNTTLVYQQTLPSGVITPAAWATVVFPNFTPAITGTFILTCFVEMAGDELLSNDSLTSSMIVTHSFADVWTKDDPNDVGNVPSSYNNWYQSPDLWVRNNPDGGTIHQDPIAGVTNTVYVRLRNRGNIALETGTVSVYWIEPSLGVRCGAWAPIGDIPFTNLLPSEERILSIPWVPTRTGHTCLQDVVDSPQDPYKRNLECSPQWVPFDNNVEWHNINILPNTGALGATDVKEAEVQLVNIFDRAKDVDLIIDRMTFPSEGTITVHLPPDLFDRWFGYGAHFEEGIEVIREYKEIRISGANEGVIGAIPMLPDEEATVGLTFDASAGLQFEMAVRERIDGITMGGVAYQWTIPDSTPPYVTNATPLQGSIGVPLNAPIVVTFSEPVDPDSLVFTSVPNLGGAVFNWNTAHIVLTITHNNLIEGQLYTLWVSAADMAGNSMPAPYMWKFRAFTAEYPIYLPMVKRP